MDTGAPVSVPVGVETLGRVFNMVGEPIDGLGPVKVGERRPIHREMPMVTEAEFAARQRAVRRAETQIHLSENR